MVASLSGWLIVCIGEAVLAKFAEIYFKNERKAGTPFTLVGAKKLLRFGILTLAIPGGCAVAGCVVRGSLAGFTKVEKVAAPETCFDKTASVVLGLVFVVGSVFCRYRAELALAEKVTAQE